jgi:hypothetical protein
VILRRSSTDNIIGVFTTPTDPDNAAALAATSFRLALGDVLRSSPGQAAARPSGVAPRGPKARPDT